MRFGSTKGEIRAKEGDFRGVIFFFLKASSGCIRMAIPNISTQSPFLKAEQNIEGGLNVLIAPLSDIPLSCINLSSRQWRSWSPSHCGNYLNCIWQNVGLTPRPIKLIDL